jgi:exodeoxyribonuclease VII large subunit
MEASPISLSALLGEVKSTLRGYMPSSYWIVGEISEIKVNYSGHCYMELIEKEADNEQIRARARATIWSSTFRMIQPYFETTTRSKLSAGMKIMVKVTVEFHELYGFSLNISDIEPSYTLGELARQKQEIINRLVAEGVFDMNKQLLLPDLPKRIAVISSLTAAGYGDFMDQITRNPYGYQFYVKLFPAVMQGSEAEQSIVSALERIYRLEEYFDAVAIIRGGGAQAELNCFNSYWMAYHICQFPLPVLTGIGHEQDETIADLVAHTRLKTPTAVAEFLLSRFIIADERINELAERFMDLVDDRLEMEKNRINSLVSKLFPLIRQRIFKDAAGLRFLKLNLETRSRECLHKNQVQLNRQGNRLLSDTRTAIMKAAHVRAFHKNTLVTTTRTLLDRLAHQLNIFEKKNQYLDPYQILRRGYSITYLNGKVVRSPDETTSGDVIDTRVYGGKLKSKIIENGMEYGKEKY